MVSAMIPVDSFISSCNAQALTGVTSTKFLNSLSSGNRYYLTEVNAVNMAGTATLVKILSEGALKWTLGGGASGDDNSVHFDPPLRMNDAEGVYVQNGSAVGQVFASINGYIGR